MIINIVKRSLQVTTFLMTFLFLQKADAMMRRVHPKTFEELQKLEEAKMRKCLQVTEFAQGAIVFKDLEFLDLTDEEFVQHYPLLAKFIDNNKATLFSRWDLLTEAYEKLIQEEIRLLGDSKNAFLEASHVKISLLQETLVQNVKRYAAAIHEYKKILEQLTQKSDKLLNCVVPKVLVFKRRKKTRSLNSVEVILADQLRESQDMCFSHDNEEDVEGNIEEKLEGIVLYLTDLCNGLVLASEKDKDAIINEISLVIQRNDTKETDYLLKVISTLLRDDDL